MKKFHLLVELLILLLVLNGANFNFNAVHSQPRSRFAHDNIRWDCQFENDACHFRNQHNMGKFNRYYNALKPVFGKHAFLLLNINNYRLVQRYPGARLISHYFPSTYPNACLFINYYATGPAPKTFIVVQQDKENHCIYYDDDLQRNLNRWKEIEIQLDLRNGDPRFFLEVHYDAIQNNQDQGIFGIGKFSFGFGECSQPEHNRCPN